VDVQVIEASETLGGKLQTDHVEGFRLDRGFQAFFTAYPHAAQVLDYAALDFRAFESGAQVRWSGRWHTVSQEHIWAAAFSSYLSPSDKLRLLAWNREVQTMDVDDPWEIPDESTNILLVRRGFSDAFIERFASPFFGGIFLDRTLEVSAQAFTFVWKMLLEGQTVIPSAGMAAIPAQLAKTLNPSAIQLNQLVTELLRDAHGRVAGVRLADGSAVMASTVVLATDPATQCRLAGVPAPAPGKSSTCVYFDVPELPEGGRPILMLQGNGPGYVNEVVPVSAVVPECAPKGRHLVSATILGTPHRSEKEIALDARYELEAWFPKLYVRGWRPLAVYCIPNAQLSQDPGFRAVADQTFRPTPGLVYAGECTTYSSIDGAILSGIRAADQVPAPQEVVAA